MTPRPAHAATPSLFDRDFELASIEHALRAGKDGTGSVIVVEGEAGIGKTSLLRHAAAGARADGFSVLSAIGSELEQSDPYGLVRSLFSDALRPSRSAGAFRGPAAAARSIIDPSTNADTDSPLDPSAALHALYWLALNLADSGPVLVVADDAHWIDDPSARFLAYLANRIEEAPIVLLLAFRPLVESAIADQLRGMPQANRLTPSPLAESSVSAIAEELGIDIDDDRRAAIWTDARGNPFYIHALLATADAPDVERGVRSLPEAIERSIAARLGPSPTPVRRVAEAIAVFGEQATIERVTRLTGLPQVEVSDAIRRMTDKGMLERTGLAFSHPIVRSVLYGAIPHSVRERQHRAAADILDASAAPAAAVAAQLLETEPAADAFVVAALRRAAARATSQGDAAGAATFLRRALAEPAGDALGDVLLELAHAEAALNSPDASGRFEAALAHAASHQRAQIRLAQGHALIGAGKWSEAVPVFEAGLADVDERDVELKSRLEAGFVSASFVGLANHQAAQDRLGRILAAPLTDPAHRELAAWTAFQQVLTLACRDTEAANLARRAITGAPLDDLVRGSQVVELAAGVFVATGDFEEELSLLDRALVAAERLGAYGKVAIYSYCRSVPHLLAGHIADAVADAQTAIAAHEHGWDAFYSGSCASLAWSLLEMGEVDAAERAITFDDAPWQGQLDFEFMVPIARGRVRMARGDPEGAVRHFERVRASGELLGIESTTILADWRTWHAVALLQLDRQRDALRAADEALDMAERWGAGVARVQARWAAGIVRRDQGIDLLREGLDISRGTPARLLEARLGLALGEGLRRAGRTTEARDVLAQAADLAHRIGARATLVRARDELIAAGARPRRDAVTGPAALTPSELRVARLATQGRTNREVAQALFVTPKAVEFHLANAYRKLGISSRAGLAGALRDEGAASV